jgi:hypothetical protein
MQVVLTRPFDDESIVEVYIVEHRDILQSKQTIRFQKDWDICKASIIEKEPETWGVSQVIEQMEKKMGWQILHVSDPITVTY